MCCASYTVAMQMCAAGRFGSIASALRAASSALGNWLFFRWSSHSRACSAARTRLLRRCAIASPTDTAVPGLPTDTVNSAARPELPMSRTRTVAVTVPPLRSSVPLVYAFTERNRPSWFACVSSSRTSHG